MCTPGATIAVRILQKFSVGGTMNVCGEQGANRYLCDMGILNLRIWVTVWIEHFLYV
jgi:hypothetical protein